MPISDQPRLLAIDFGTKRLGIAYAVSGVISTLPAINNDDKLLSNLQEIISEYSISKIYIGLSEGKIAKKTLHFVSTLRSVLKLPVETIEEAVSTIEATEIFQQNRGKNKRYKNLVDSIAAAVILRRVINFS